MSWKTALFVSTVLIKNNNSKLHGLPCGSTKSLLFHSPEGSQAISKAAILQLWNCLCCIFKWSPGRCQVGTNSHQYSYHCLTDACHSGAVLTNPRLKKKTLKSQHATHRISSCFKKKKVTAYYELWSGYIINGGPLVFFKNKEQ